MGFVTQRLRTALRSSQAGFTLLELLVVIAIIAILAAVVVTNLSTARSKANDTKVQTDLNSLAVAINVYTTTNNNFTGFNTGTGATPPDNIATLATAVTTNNLIKKMPTHPITTEAYHYRASDKDSDGVLDYVLWGKLGSGKCFVNANGTSFTGDCTTDTVL
ncbi:prepilin-type N-terminal cleavage/methylation domain-containing protein [Candidatus Berkelbacteria bacterium]|nr:prepilin-type N-terminal cleavage/methylation domain-containing protein [Candidatus Berkelbacteria bacterium]